MEKQSTYDEKLRALKRIHARSAPEARKALDKWGDELSRLAMEAEWLAHPSTQALRQTLTMQLENITTVLSSDEGLSEIDRKAYFKAKGVVLSLLALISRDPETEAAVIREQIDDEMENV